MDGCAWKVIDGYQSFRKLGDEWNVVGHLNPSFSRDGDKLKLSSSLQRVGGGQWWCWVSRGGEGGCGLMGQDGH